MTAVDHPSQFVEVFDVSFTALDGTLIHAWLLIPKIGDAEKYPLLMYVSFIFSYYHWTNFMTVTSGIILSLRMIAQYPRCIFLL